MILWVKRHHSCGNLSFCQCKATRVMLVTQAGCAELQRERDRKGQKYVLRVRQTDRGRGRDGEPEGGWGRRGRWRATCCETSKSNLSPTLFDLSPSTKPIIILLSQCVVCLKHFLVKKKKKKCFWGKRNDTKDLGEDSKRTEFGIWICVSSLYRFTFLYLFLPLGLAFSFAPFSLPQSPSIYLLMMVAKRRCLKMIRVK